MLTKQGPGGILRRRIQLQKTWIGESTGMDNNSKKRMKKLIISVLSVLVAGIAYLIFIRLAGWGIPCLFRTFLGIYCPGCGISRMFVALSRFDIHSAFQYNPLVLCLLPFAVAFGSRYAVSYVRKGRTEPDRLESVLLFIVMILTVVFWILRNLPNSTFIPL